MFPKPNLSPTESSRTGTDLDPPKKPVTSMASLPEPLLDSEEAAAIVKIHPKTLQRLARRGIVRGVQIGRLWRFRASEIEDWIQQKLAG